jgi:hypothetical protein
MRIMANSRSSLFAWILLVVLTATTTRVTHAQGIDPCRSCIVLQNIYNAYSYVCGTDSVNAINRDCFETMLFSTTRWYNRYKVVHNFTPENDPDCTCSEFREEFSPCGYSSNPAFITADFWDLVPPCSATSWIVTLKGKRAFQQIQCADGRLFVRTLDECPAELEISPPIRISLEGCCPSWIPVLPVDITITSDGE